MNTDADLIGHSTHEKGVAGFSAATCFAPEQYFLGLATRAVKGGGNTRFLLADTGELVVRPASGTWHAEISDMTAFCRANATAFRVAHLNDDDADALAREMGPARPIRDLLWQAAFHASQGRLIAAAGQGKQPSMLDVVQFHRWPNLTRLPQTPNTMRICALLTRYPTSLAMVSRKLSIDPEEVYQVYSAAYGSGIASIVGSPNADEALAAYSFAGEWKGHAREMLHSLFSKLSGL